MSDIIKMEQGGAELLYRPMDSPKGAVIICAGGGYQMAQPPRRMACGGLL